MRIVMFMGAIMSLGLPAFGGDATDAIEPFHPKVREYLQQRLVEFDQIPDGRRKQLQDIADYIESSLTDQQPPLLMFICTHNSRRSQFCQIWAATAAGYYGIPNIETFSGGTETTAFNPRAVAAIERTGMKVAKVDDEKNPRYEVRFRETGKPLLCYSKVYDDSSNPQRGFCAVMTCSQADNSCPTVTGSSLRVSLPYDDPKAVDDTPEERARYDERCAQISREMMYLFSLIGR